MWLRQHATKYWLQQQPINRPYSAAIGVCVARRYAPEKVPYAIERYSKESKRLLGVLEARLKETGGPYIMGQDYTIAGARGSHWVCCQG